MTQDYALWREILGIARQAPSPHNVQPWQVRLVSEREAELFIDRRRILPKEDTTGAFILSAMGMFIEAIAILAIPRGMDLHFSLHQTPEWYATLISSDKTEPEGELAGEWEHLIPFARLELKPAAIHDPRYPSSLFLKRRTSRIPLLPRPADPSSTEALSKLAAEWGQHYREITDPVRIEEVLSQNTDALFFDLNSAGYHDEIVSWFRFTDRVSRRSRDGLDRRCMNVSWPEFWLVARWPRLLLFPLVRSFFRRRYRRQIGPVPTLGLLAGKFFRAEDAVQSGRFLLRFWLEVTRQGLYLQPFGNLVTNQAAAAWLREVTGLEDIWFVFKIGYSDAPPQSYRRALNDILIS